jgi:calreticulin
LGFVLVPGLTVLVLCFADTTSARLTQPFVRSTSSGDLVIQYSIKNEQSWIECGGGYIKFFGPGLNQAAFTSESPELYDAFCSRLHSRLSNTGVVFGAGLRSAPISAARKPRTSLLLCALMTKSTRTRSTSGWSLADAALLISLNCVCSCESNKQTHFYTLVIRKDNTYEVLVDNES